MRWLPFDTPQIREYLGHKFTSHSFNHPPTTSQVFLFLRKIVLRTMAQDRMTRTSAYLTSLDHVPATTIRKLTGNRDEQELLGTTHSAELMRKSSVNVR